MSEFKPVPFDISPELASSIMKLYADSFEADLEIGAALCEVNNKVELQSKCIGNDCFIPTSAIRDCHTGKRIGTVHTHPDRRSVMEKLLMQSNAEAMKRLVTEGWIVDLKETMLGIEVNQFKKTEFTPQETHEMMKTATRLGEQAGKLTSIAEASAGDLLDAGSSPPGQHCSISGDHKMFCYENQEQLPREDIIMKYVPYPFKARLHAESEDPAGWYLFQDFLQLPGRVMEKFTEDHFKVSMTRL